MGDGQDQEEAQSQGELEDLAEQVHPVGLEKQIPLLEQAVAGNQDADGRQGQGNLVVLLHLHLAPQGEAEEHQGHAQIKEFRSEEHHVHGYIPWRNGTTEDLIMLTISCGKNPKRSKVPMRIIRGMRQERTDVLKVHEFRVGCR